MVAEVGSSAHHQVIKNLKMQHFTVMSILLFVYDLFLAGMYIFMIQCRYFIAHVIADVLVLIVFLLLMIASLYFTLRADLYHEDENVVTVLLLTVRKETTVKMFYLFFGVMMFLRKGPYANGPLEIAVDDEDDDRMSFESGEDYIVPPIFYVYIVMHIVYIVLEHIFEFVLIRAL